MIRLPKISTQEIHIAQNPSTTFGCGSIKNLKNTLSNFGPTVLLITGNQSYRKSKYRNGIEHSLRQHGRFYIFPISGEPSPEDIDLATDTYKNKNIDVVVAIGGGSVLDAGKAISAMLTENGKTHDFLEGVGTKIPSRNKIPLIAVPTTSGTGSEATKNAVITQAGKNGFKKSLRHNNYVPNITIIDPELTISCSPQQTAYSGMDAFTQLLEAYVSTKSNAYTDSLALSGLYHISQCLELSVVNGKNKEARTGMAYAAYLSGICLANAGLGLIHGYAQPLGSLFPIPHGAVCGSLMGTVNRITVSQLISNDPNSYVLKKYALAGQMFSKKENCKDLYYINTLLDTIDQYTKTFKIPTLNEYGVKEQYFNTILDKTELKNHPIKLNRQDLYQILLARIIH